MSVIKRLGNLAKGKMLEWSDDEASSGDAAVRKELEALEAQARVPAPGAPSPQAAPPPMSTDPLEARRDAVRRAFTAGVISEAERDTKLDAIDAEAFAPPKPKPRRL